MRRRTPRSTLFPYTTLFRSQDLDALVNYWTAIQNEAKNYPAPSLIHKESDIITRAFRDYLRDDVGDILIDNPKVMEVAKKRLVDLGRVEDRKSVV